MPALAIIEASETTAKDVEEAAQAAVDIAADIMKEAQQLATEVRANGKKMSEHLKEFATLANKVSTAMRNTRAEAAESLHASEHGLLGGIWHKLVRKLLPGPRIFDHDSVGCR